MPVLPVTPQVVVTWMPTRPSGRSPSATGAHSTFAFVMLSGWHMGMSVLVCLAAMTPATRAHASTSPFDALPSTMSASVSGCMAMKPSATATRSVSAFCDTSTMRTSPCSSIWVSCCSVMGVSLVRYLAGWKVAGWRSKPARRDEVRRIRGIARAKRTSVREPLGSREGGTPRPFAPLRGLAPRRSVGRFRLP